jgi:hypothetical protein
LQVTGASVLVVAGWSISSTVGLVVAGVGLLAFGVAAEAG